MVCSNAALRTRDHDRRPALARVAVWLDAMLAAEGRRTGRSCPDSPARAVAARIAGSSRGIGLPRSSRASRRSQRMRRQPSAIRFDRATSDASGLDIGPARDASPKRIRPAAAPAEAVVGHPAPSASDQRPSRVERRVRAAASAPSTMRSTRRRTPMPRSARFARQTVSDPDVSANAGDWRRGAASSAHRRHRRRSSTSGVARDVILVTRLPVRPLSPFRAPLLRHRRGDARIGPAPVPPAVRPGRLAVHPRLAALDDGGRRQPRQAPQPQAGRLGLGMPELPGLDRLRRRRDVEEPPDVPEHDRVLDRDPRDRRRRAWRGRTPPHARGWPSGRRRRRSPAGSRGRDASRRCWRGRCTAGARSAGPSRRRRTSRTSPMMCGPGRSEGSRSQDTASWPRARKASRTTPENSQATRMRMGGSRGGRLARALRRLRAPAPRPRRSRSAFTAAKLRPSPSRIASRPVSACQRSTATST